MGNKDYCAQSQLVDIPNQDINCMESYVKCTKQEFVVSDILQIGSGIESRYGNVLVDAFYLVCPYQSTLEKDVPIDGKREMRCYIRKSVDEAEVDADVSRTQLLYIWGEVHGIPVKFLVDRGASENFIVNIL